MMKQAVVLEGFTDRGVTHVLVYADDGIGTLVRVDPLGNVLHAGTLKHRERLEMRRYMTKGVNAKRYYIVEG
jgi:hypothetical protein